VSLTENQNFMAKIINFSWFKFFKKFLLRKINYIRCLNKKIYSDLINMNFPSKNILELPNGIDSKRLIGLDKTERNNINFGFVGRLTKIKNMDFLLEVFRYYFYKYPIDKLLIYGEGPEYEKIQEWIIQNNMIHNIFLIGFENNKDKIYSNLDVIVNSSYGEGISNVILEAMATKTFVIASNVQGNSDLIKHKVTGLLYNFKEKNSIIKQLIFYKNNKKSINQILKNAEKEIILKYDIGVIANKYYEFLKSNLT
jgi:glycosyltransferase involved in cell wall biosynthesis